MIFSGGFEQDLSMFRIKHQKLFEYFYVCKDAKNAKIEAENEPLFKAGEMQIKHYYEKNADNKDELIDNFTGRMVNERMNMEEISREIAAAAPGTDPEKLILQPVYQPPQI